MKIILLLIAFLSIPLSNQGGDQHTKAKKLMSEYITVNGKQLYIEREGKGQPLLLLPGGPANNHLIFQPYFSALADQFEIIYVDYYGRGKSEKPKNYDGITFDGDVEDIEGLRKALGYEKWSLYGFSYGGMVAQGYALKYPDAVSKLILANTLHSPEMWQKNHENINREIENQFPEVWQRIQELRARGLQSNAPEMIEAFAATRGNELVRFYDGSKDALRASELNQRNQDPAYTYNKDLYYTFTGINIEFFIGGQIPTIPDFRPRLKELKMPILIIAGRFDRALYPRYQLQFKQYAPQARFVMLEKSGSFAHIEEPEKLYSLVRDFLHH